MEFNYTQEMTKIYNQEQAERYYQRFVDKEPTWTLIPLLIQAVGIEKSSVIDLGCGPGLSARILLEQLSCTRYLGVDASVHQVNTAKKHCLDPKAEFIHGDVLQFLSGCLRKFDVALAAFIIPHLSCKKDLTLLFEKMKNSITKEGKAIIIFIDEEEVVKYGNHARSINFGPITYQLDEDEQNWKSGCKFTAIFSENSKAPGYIWFSEDIINSAKVFFKNVELLSAIDLVQNEINSGIVSKESAMLMRLLKCTN